MTEQTPPTWKNEKRKLADLIPYKHNPRTITEQQRTDLQKSLERFNLADPFIVNTDNLIIGGHQRAALMLLLGQGDQWVDVRIPDRKLSEEEVKELNLRLNKNTGDWDWGILAENFDVDLLKEVGFSDKELVPLFQHWEKHELVRALKDDYIIPPFSYWDMRSYTWQQRKKLWKKYYGDSREGRREDLLGHGGMKDLAIRSGAPNLNGTSEFDPVVTEICYRWFTPQKGKILDPFAGGSVRGVVASLLGYEYYGIDLSKRQIEEDQKAAERLGLTPNFYQGNSLNIKKIVPAQEYDFIFSCPPYFDLEQYTDDPQDLSNKDYGQFKKEYAQIIRDSVSMLAPNRFACFVVSDVRDDNGFYRGFVMETIRAFEEAGMKLYNEIILVNSFATAGLRARRQFATGAKVVRVHQNVLCFYQGSVKDMRKRIESLPKVERDHGNILVFFHGDPAQIRKDFEFTKISNVEVFE